MEGSTFDVLDLDVSIYALDDIEMEGMPASSVDLLADPSEVEEVTPTTLGWPTEIPADLDSPVSSGAVEETTPTVLEMPDELLTEPIGVAEGLSPTPEKPAEPQDMPSSSPGRPEGKPTFPCDVPGCGRGPFVSKEARFRHWHCLHVPEVSLYVCGVCDTQSKRAWNIVDHARKQHGLDRTQVAYPVMYRSEPCHNRAFHHPGATPVPDGFTTWLQKRMGEVKLASELSPADLRQLNHHRQKPLQPERCHDSPGPREETCAPVALDMQERELWKSKCVAWRREAETLKAKLTTERREVRRERERRINVERCLERTNRCLRESAQDVRRLEALGQCVCRLDVPEPAWAQPVATCATQTSDI